MFFGPKGPNVILSGNRTCPGVLPITHTGRSRPHRKNASRGRVTALLSARHRPTAFQKPFPEFWNTLERSDTTFRPQPLAALQWPASRAPCFGAKRSFQGRGPSVAGQAAFRSHAHSAVPPSRVDDQ